MILKVDLRNQLESSKVSIHFLKIGTYMTFLANMKHM